MKKKLYFVLGGIPVISHPFLYNQIKEVIETDVFDVKIIALKIEPGRIHKAYETLMQKVILIPMGTGQPIFRKMGWVLRSMLLLAVRKPGVLFKALNIRKYGRNAWSGNYVILAAGFIKISPDILHSHFGPTAKIIADLKDIGAIKGKLLSSFHGADITVSRQYGNNYYERLFRTSGLFTGNSGFIISKMIDNHCPAAKIRKIPECLNIADFSYRAETPGRDPLRLLTVGRFVEKKGYEFSLKAVALLKKKKVPFLYDVIGEGPLRKDMEKLAKVLDIEQEVIFHGAMHQEQVKKFYESSHIFLLPSVTGADGDTEGQGLVLQEAQAIGIPVVATLHNGFPDSIIDGESGYLVPEKDAQSLYEKLALLSSDESLCIRMGKRGRQFVEEKFDAKVVVGDLNKIYAELLS